MTGTDYPTTPSAIINTLEAEVQRLRKDMEYAVEALDRRPIGPDTVAAVCGYLEASLEEL